MGSLPITNAIGYDMDEGEVRSNEMRLGALGHASLIFVALAGCSLSESFVAPEALTRQAHEPSRSEIDASLILIGDAGKPAATGREPVLEALKLEAARLSDRTMVVFLGDNIYPSGLPAPNDPGHAEATRRLNAQLDAVSTTGAQILFVAGNHDYRSGGLKSVRREARLISEFPMTVGRPARFEPEPGKAIGRTQRIGQRLCVVPLDTEQWLGFAEASLSDGDDHGPAAVRLRETIASLSRAVAEAGDSYVVVVGHYPLATHGRHGGFFDWRSHLFPTTELASWLWIPLPGLGSFYPLLRQSGIRREDLSSPRNSHMRAALRSAFTPGSPLIYAAGHEHCLQLLREGDGPFLIVSGAGSLSRPDIVSVGPDTLFASPAAGFFRVDVLTNGDVRLQAIEVEDCGKIRRPMSVWLKKGKEASSWARAPRESAGRVAVCD